MLEVEMRQLTYWSQVAAVEHARAQVLMVAMQAQRHPVCLLELVTTREVSLLSMQIHLQITSRQDHLFYAAHLRMLTPMLDTVAKALVQVTVMAEQVGWAMDMRMEVVQQQPQKN
jgi:hypothetical protein